MSASRSGNGFVLSGNKPLSEPMLTWICVTKWHQQLCGNYVFWQFFTNQISWTINDLKYDFIGEILFKMSDKIELNTVAL